MQLHSQLSRRGFLAAAAAGSALSAFARDKKIPVGLELYSVRNQMHKDLMGTVRAVGKMGYECVEFYAPYLAWNPDYAKKVRALLDELNVRCYSTHNDAASFTDKNLPHAIELNHILGSQYLVLASAGKVADMSGWREVAGQLNAAAAKLKPEGLRTGYHNHQVEFKPVDGMRPIDVIAAHTGDDVMLQLDVGTCLEAGADPIAWINKRAGRIRSIHCKDWSEKDGYRVLFGEGAAPWKKIFETAESVGGVEYYLIEQEGSAYPEMETVDRCLQNFRKIYG